MLFKCEIEALFFKSVESDPLAIWNIFYYFFGNYLRSDSDEKVDLGNNERPSVQPPKCALNIYTTAFSTIHYSSLT